MTLPPRKPVRRGGIYYGTYAKNSNNKTYDYSENSHNTTTSIDKSTHTNTTHNNGTMNTTNNPVTNHYSKVDELARAHQKEYQSAREKEVQSKNPFLQNQPETPISNPFYPQSTRPMTWRDFKQPLPSPQPSRQWYMEPVTESPEPYYQSVTQLQSHVPLPPSSDYEPDIFRYHPDYNMSEETLSYPTLKDYPAGISARSPSYRGSKPFIQYTRYDVNQDRYVPETPKTGSAFLSPLILPQC
ncbi:hypothetical protein BDQ12DRAFT_735001 [Crucibulum laeve]|uniref:Uncharacterized protein n=1 Tax=Crucibulum laeve TaxID=68775 RepID=A0A5C3M1C5_9AGAR|nr:hypothetical protein BDQ12DRAFT_735001 [Crucibulum laeve]